MATDVADLIEGSITAQEAMELVYRDTDNNSSNWSWVASDDDIQVRLSDGRIIEIHPMIRPHQSAPSLSFILKS